MNTLITTTVSQKAAKASGYGLRSVLGSVGSSEGPVAWDFTAVGQTDLVGQFTTDSDGITSTTVGQPKDLDLGSVGHQEARAFTVITSFTGGLLCEADMRETFRLRLDTALETAIMGTWSTSHYPSFSANTGSPPLVMETTDTLGGAIDRAQYEVRKVAGNIVGVLHLPDVYLNQALARDLLEMKDGKVFTPNGWPVSAGTGYGTDPRVWATPPLNAFAGEEIVLDTTQPWVNDRTQLIEQTWVIGWDTVTAMVSFTKSQTSTIEIFGAGVQP